MSDTKNQILWTALELFSKNGFEAVSVSMIAGAMGMTKGALYKHYQNKQDIFDQLVQRMYQLDEERSRQYRVPDQEYQKDETAYENTEVQSFMDFTQAQFQFWTEDRFAAAFRRMLLLEQYKNPEMGKLYCQMISKGPVQYTADVFQSWMKQKILKQGDSYLLAMEYYAPVYLMIQLSDHGEDSEVLKKQVNQHIKKFMEEITCSI